MRFSIEDVRASVVVFLVALPLCLGIALASDAPLAAGVVAGIVGGVVVGLLGGSQVSVSGPAAGLTVLVAHGVHDLGSFSAVCAAVVVAGVLQIGMGLLRAGSLGDFFPSSVIKGMLAAIGLILILKQLPHAVGYDADYMGDESFEQRDGHNTLSEVTYALESLHPGAAIVAVLSLLILIFWDKLAARVRALGNVPAALVAVLVAVLLNELVLVGIPGFAIEASHRVNLPFEGGFGSLFSALTLPDFGALGQAATWRLAITLGVVASVETLLSLDAADKLDPVRRISDKNRELLAQGVGNATSGLLGGLPLTAVIVRTSANVAGGARSSLSAVLHGLWLLVAILLVPNVLDRIPLAALAAVLLLVGYKLAKPKLFVAAWKEGPNQFLPFVVTVVAILLTDLLIGIAVGMVVGLYFVLRGSLFKTMILMQEDHRYLLRFSKDVTFLHKGELRGLLRSIPDGAEITIDGSRSVQIDHDIVEVVADFVDTAPSRGIQAGVTRSPLALAPYFRS